MNRQNTFILYMHYHKSKLGTPKYRISLISENREKIIDMFICTVREKS